MKRTTNTSARLLLLLIPLLASCSPERQYTRYPGVFYVAPFDRLGATSLVWSPSDPSSILVNSSSMTSGRAEVSLLDVMTGQKTVMEQVGFGSISGSSWSPDGKQIALLNNGTTKNGWGPGLWILNRANGSMRLASERRSLSGTDSAAIWLRDGNTLAILGVEFFPRRLVISLVDTQSGIEKTLYSNPGAFLLRGASLSPNGDQLVFSMQASDRGPTDLYFIDLSTGKVSQFTHNGVSVDPAWSPAETVIAYSATTDAEGQLLNRLHLIASDGGCDVELAQFRWASSPTWSPDGKRLAFIGLGGIYIADLDRLLGRDINKNLCEPK